MLHNLPNDLRYALRSLSRAPGFAAAAIVTIALGVGVNSGIFSVINGVLFRNIPAPDARELVSIYQTIDGVPERENALAGLATTAEFRAYRDGATGSAALAGHSNTIGALLGGEAPRQTAGLLVTCAYFDVLDQPPALGRAPTERDCRSGADPVVVLGHEIWVSTFGADPTVVGRTIELGRQSFTVVGVAREGTYGGMFRPAFFAPIATQPLLLPSANSYANDRVGWLYLLGRRAAGVTIDQVRAQLGVVAADIDRQEAGRSTTLSVERAKPLTVPPFARGAALGAGAVVLTAFALILLIACANVANLMLARGAARSREIAVRLSLGASRALVIRQLLIESLLLAIAGGTLGSLLALGSFRTLLALALPTITPVGLPPLGLDVSPDFRVLASTVALTFGTGVLFGLAPALQASKADLHSVMKQDSHGGGNRRGGRLQGMLVGAQVALCMVLMIGAGLLLRGPAGRAHGRPRLRLPRRHRTLLRLRLGHGPRAGFFVLATAASRNRGAAGRRGHGLRHARSRGRGLRDRRRAPAGRRRRRRAHRRAELCQPRLLLGAGAADAARPHVRGERARRQIRASPS